MYAVRNDGLGWRMVSSEGEVSSNEYFSATQPEMPVEQVPRIVTMRQARLALLNAGFLEQVSNAVLALPKSTQIEWEFAVSVERINPLVNSILSSLGQTSDQIDQLFIAASEIA